MYPIDDYPDIFYIYQEMIRKSSLFSIAKFVDLFDLFRQYSCYVFIPRSLNSLRTVDLPEPIPPVNPTIFILNLIYQ